ncbi:hypothetical protein GCM10009841_08980 [Microlunatus panaciterrae]|uniref:Ser/Thr protein kinase RdoA (MazF antagonist) n=1 Tax=Microlunatus panaciterrae TaxID=400768 RepID=A0ABS2RNC0_9ACTN|nr:aminoglycoside phosphotransferase family protein [Microlunatus panaciterrae]MBM7799444.1 Ser/Thr protein kinase RdoA (MazF antagonist) [Microlunatus panaciterrae]
MPQPLTIPARATARRPHWQDLPAAVRGLVQDQLRAGVARAISQDSGFTPGFASRLLLTDGTSVFVKATNPEQEWTRQAYRAEAAKLALLPTAVPVPRLRWSYDGDIDGAAWVILIFDDVGGRPPQRPWSRTEARLVLDTAGAMSRTLTPAPAGADWMTLAEEFAAERGRWDELPAEGIWLTRREEARALADEALQLCTGETLVHCDLRDDNVIIGRDRAVWFCDWNFTVVGPAWADSVSLAVSMHGDGLDADVLLADSQQLSRADHEAIDCFLALLIGYFRHAGAQPAPPTSPYLRAHQRWYADVATDWLAQRRCW